ncbi:hypothetical protein [Endozoicomonas sp. 4G]|uniref:DUF7683 domain-containing protein n=1 Tax=Endozoicomonas sp. 4G TaxID=2872754 RepID=UPI0020789169|nr:hypothetical protein [Endozoicomonas sp. 4G]
MGFKIECFSNRTERLVDEKPISGTPLSKLQDLFEVPRNNSMYDGGYPIEEKDVEKIRFFSYFFGINFDFHKNSYFLIYRADS